MILKLKIELLKFYHYNEFEEWYRVIELDEDTTLAEIHIMIQELIDFENDHLYEFFVADNYMSRKKERFFHDQDLTHEYSVKDLYPLQKHKKIFYLFDYGDTWLFRISKVNPRSKKEESGIEYPRVLKSVGENPDQYKDEGEW